MNMETTHSVDKRPHKLNDVQILLLRMFNRNMTEQETAEVKKLLLNYYDEKLATELDEVVAEKQYTQQDYDTMLNRQDRTGFKQEISRKGNAGSH